MDFWICCLFIYCLTISSEYVTMAFSLPATARSCAASNSNWMCRLYRKKGRRSHTLISVMRRDGTSDSVMNAVANGSSWRPSVQLREHHLIDSGVSGINCICLRNTYLRGQHHYALMHRKQRHIASCMRWNISDYIWLCELKHSYINLKVIAWQSGSHAKPTSIPIDITHAAEVQHIASYLLRRDEADIVVLIFTAVKKLKPCGRLSTI